MEVYFKQAIYLIFGLFILVIIYGYSRTAAVYLSILTLVLLLINKYDKFKNL